jgi:hypothetical protein
MGRDDRFVGLVGRMTHAAPRWWCNVWRPKFVRTRPTEINPVAGVATGLLFSDFLDRPGPPRSFPRAGPADDHCSDETT